jgi:RNA polymerase sigma-70 factor (ECF subfamily)
VPPAEDSGSASSSSASQAELEPLVQALIHRDEAALGRLYDLTIGRVYSLALALTGNRADAEEVAGDVYLQIWQRAAQYDAQRGSVLAWLLVHCRSLALDRLRRRRRHETGQVELGDDVVQEQPDPTAGVDEWLTLIQEGTRVHHAMQVLSAEQRRLIVLAYFRDLSHQQIAATTGVPLGTVKSHIRRGLQVLRTALQA